MKPERLREIESLFHSTLEVPRTERQAFLANACQDDDLRKEVERLLAADQKAGFFLEKPLLGERQKNTTSHFGSAFRNRVDRVHDLLQDISKRKQVDSDHPNDDHRSDLPGVGFDGLTGLREDGSVLADRYRLRQLLGTGGMGEVFRAEDLKLGQTVAVKVLYPVLQEDTRILNRFLDEVRISRQISHPNVCRVFDVGEADGQHFLSMEYIDGQNLASFLQRYGRPPRDVAQRLAHDLCLGLAAAHQKGAVHRDLKPSNLMVDRKGRLVVTDFGLAILADKVQGQEAKMGTPAYMAPEQHTGLGASKQSDIYALGLVLYELFTGSPAFPHHLSREALAHLHQETDPSPPTRIIPELPLSIERIILQCLAKTPQDRPHSAGVVARIFSDSNGTQLKTLLMIDGSGSKTASVADSETEALSLLKQYDGCRATISNGTAVYVFDHPIQGVCFALAWQRKNGTGIGVHLGEVQASEIDHDASKIVQALALLARHGQILITRGAFDLARQKPLEDFPSVQWLAYGSWEIQGSVAPLELCEVGALGAAPLQAPLESPSARRQILQETVPGWRPAPGLPLPQRTDWTMDRKLGQGGFGEIWLVRNLKAGNDGDRVFKFCFDSARLRALQREITLFRLLREALGERPDITRILDWNFKTAPYYIESEYVAGGNLHRWAKEQGGLGSLPLKTRLELIAQIADALAAAHSVGVLHKDVKPGNVLIKTDAPNSFQAQLCDFGLGLLTEKDRLKDFQITQLGLSTLLNTTRQPSSTAGTRLYLAPELLEGRNATLQSDIYALGVMLYQVIVCDLSRSLAPGWERDVEDALLIEDISAAVDRDASRRLSSASQLATRLRRLEARRQERTALKRLVQEADDNRKLLARGRRRRRLSVLAICILLGFSSISWMQARRISREARETHQAADLLTDFFKFSDPSEGHGASLTVRQMLDLGLEKLDTRIDEDSKILAPLLHTVGTVYRNLGVYDRAEEQIRKSLAIHRKVYGEFHPEVAASLNTLADIKRRQSDLDEAENLARKALALRRSIFGEQHADVAESLELLGFILHHQGKFEESERSYRSALDMRRKFFGTDHLLVANTKVRLGILLHGGGEFAEAEQLHRQALDVRRQQLGDDHPEIAASLDALARVLQTRGDYAQANSYIREALAMRQRIFGEEHPDVAENLRGLGRLLMKINDFTAAEITFTEAIRIYRVTLGEDHPYVAAALSDLAHLHVRQNNDDLAKKYFNEALEIRRAKLGNHHPLVALTFNHLNNLTMKQAQSP